jgi:AAA family ATP:ADP antiporter
MDMPSILPAAALPVPRMAPAGHASIIESMPLHAARALERLAGASVDAGESRAVLRFVGGLFLLLTAYYILKVVREPLILATGSAVSRSYARAAQAALLIAVVPLYSALANRITPAVLVQYVFLFFVVSLLAFVGLGHAGIPIGFAFFVWLGIFSTMSIAQFWSLANDLFTEAEGERLFPLVAIGGTLGAIAGAQIASRGIGALGPFGLMLLAALLVAGSMACTASGSRAWRMRAAACGGSNVAAAAPGGTRIAHDPHSGFTLLLRDRYLLLIAGAVLLVNLVNTTGDYMLAELVSRSADAASDGASDAEAARRTWIGVFYGNFQTAISALTALAQMLLVARLFRWAGLERALFVLPAIVLLGYGTVALLPLLGLLAAVKVLENSTEYSLQNTLQQALFLPTSLDTKYKAKAAIDTFVVRAGDVGSAALVWLGTSFALGVEGFAVVNLVIGMVWLLLIVRLARQHRAIAEAHPKAASHATGPR